MIFIFVVYFLIINALYRNSFTFSELIELTSDEKTLFKTHNCNPSLFVYIKKFVYVGKIENDETVAESLKVNSSFHKVLNIKNLSNQVSSVDFISDEALAIIIKKKVYFYHLETQIYRIVQHQKYFNSINCEVCCDSIDVCKKYSCACVAYLKDSINKLILFMANCNDESIKLIEVKSQLYIRSAAFLKTIEVIAVLVTLPENNTMGDKNLIKYLPTEKSSSPFTAESSENLNLKIVPDQEDFLIIWSNSSLLYSTNNGQVVLPLKTYYIDSENKQIFKVSQFTLSSSFSICSNGGFAFLTVNGDILYGILSLESFALIARNVLDSTEVESQVLMFSLDCSLQLLKMEKNETSLTVNKTVVPLEKFIPDKELIQCTTVEFKIVQDVSHVLLDKIDELSITSNHLHVGGVENNLAVTVTNPDLIQKELTEESSERELHGNTRDITIIRLSITKKFSEQHRPKNETGPIAASLVHIYASKIPLTCDKKVHKVIRVEVGCSAQRRLVIEKNENFTFCKKYKKDNVRINMILGPLASVYFYEERYPFAKLSSDGSVDVIYNYSLLGCPIVTSILEPLVPQVHLFEGNTDLGLIEGDFTIFDIFGHGDHHFVLNPVQAECVVAPQNWERMLKEQNDPQKAWSSENYKPCYIQSENKSRVVRNEEYEIMNLTNKNGINFSPASEELVFFELVLLDPSVSFCNLRTLFAVHNAYYQKAWYTWIPLIIVLVIVVVTWIIFIVIFYFCRLRLVEMIFAKPQDRDDWDEISVESQEI